MLNHSQLLSLLAFQSATSEAWPDTVHVNSLAFLLLSGYSTFSHSPNTALPPVHPALFRTECLYADLLHSNILQSIWISLLLIWSSMQLPVTVKKKPRTASSVSFRYEESRGTPRYFTSVPTQHFFIPFRNRTHSVSLRAILFVFVASVSISLYSRILLYSTCRYSRRKKYAKWEI